MCVGGGGGVLGDTGGGGGQKCKITNKNHHRIHIHMLVI